MVDFDLPEDVELYAGFVFHSAPHRHKPGKFYVSLEEYPFHLWPPYVTAGAYVLSRAALIGMVFRECVPTTKAGHLHGCSLVSLLAAVKQNILLLIHESATALPVAYLDSAQTAQAGPCEGRPQAVQWLLHVSGEECCV